MFWTLSDIAMNIDIVEPADSCSDDQNITFSSQDEAARFIEKYISYYWDNELIIQQALIKIGESPKASSQELADQLAQLIVSGRLRVRRSRPPWDGEFRTASGMALGTWNTCEPIKAATAAPAAESKVQDKPRATSMVKIDDPKVVLVKKPNQSEAHRIPVALRIVSDTMLTIADPSDLDVDAELTWTNTGKIKIYKSANDTDAQKSPMKFDAVELAKKEQTVFVEAAEASDSVGDVEFELALKAKSKWEVATRDSQKNTITCVDLTLDICHNREKAGADPKPMSENDKINVGRIIYQQDAGNHQSRALLVVRKVKPEKFDGKFVLEGVNTEHIELYTNEQPTPGESAIKLSHEFNLNTEKNEDKNFWIQGKKVSKAQRDVSLFLNIKSDPKIRADNVFLTVRKKLVVDLTFDVGPNPMNTPRVLEILKKHNIKATFFVTGENAEKYPDIIKQTVAEGHILGNHTYSHKDLSKCSVEQTLSELQRAQAAIDQAMGHHIEIIMVRPPYGATNSSTMKALNLPSIWCSGT